MVTISLDEQGKFENDTGEEKSPLFIGGVLFDDHEVPGEYRMEARRIDLYLRAVCKQTNTSYPQDLHVEGTNSKNVYKVKRKLTETLPDFFQKGYCTFENNPFSEELCHMPGRKGNYYIFAYVKYKSGVKKLSGESVSSLIRTGYASNLYLHMAEEVIGRLLFHNPVIDNIEKIHLELATRRVVVEDNTDTLKEYLKLGYRDDPNPFHKKEGKKTFILTDANIYRTALEREMMNANQSHVRIEQFNVRSIYYGDDKASLQMAFLYLADIVCSMLGYRPDTVSPQAFISDFMSKAEIYTGHGSNLIFVYDDVDMIFKEAWKKFEDRDCFEALRLVYRGKKSKSPYADFYEENWFQRLKECMAAEADTETFSIAVRKYYLLTRKNNVAQDELIDLYRMFEAMAQKVNFRTKEDKAVLYELYDAGTAAFCHIGDSVHAKECFEKCREYAGYVEIERYLRTRNKMVVYLTDYFDFAGALEIAQENVIFQEELLAVRGLIFDREEISKEYGIALSQLGQIQASLHIEAGEHTFLKALGQMEEDSPDYMQTESYLLHYYLEMDEKEKYDEVSTQYFGGKRNKTAQLRFVISEGAKGENARFSMKFAMYVFVKGLYRFHLEDISDELTDKLLHIEDEIERVGGKAASDQINNHPWEIIYKYLALIACKKGNMDKAEEYIQKAGTILDYHEFTLDVISRFGELEYAMESQKYETTDALPDELKNLFYENVPDVYEKIQGKNIADAYAYLRNDVINFMYR